MTLCGGAAEQGVAPDGRAGLSGRRRTPAHSSGSPKRLAGVRPMIVSYRSFIFLMGAVMSVVIQPGRMALT